MFLRKLLKESNKFVVQVPVTSFSQERKENKKENIGASRVSIRNAKMELAIQLLYVSSCNPTTSKSF